MTLPIPQNRYMSQSIKFFLREVTKKRRKCRYNQQNLITWIAKNKRTTLKKHNKKRRYRTKVIGIHVNYIFRVVVVFNGSNNKHLMMVKRFLIH